MYEFDIDRLSAEIIDAFENKRTVNDFFVHLTVDHPEIVSEQQKLSLTTNYENRIKELLLINMLYVDGID